MNFKDAALERQLSWESPARDRKKKMAPASCNSGGIVRPNLYLVQLI